MKKDLKIEKSNEEIATKEVANSSIKDVTKENEAPVAEENITEDVKNEKAEVEETVDKKAVDYGEWNPYIEKLQNSRYVLGNGYLLAVGAKDLVPISNFLPVINTQITYKNGKDETTFYDVNALLLDKSKALPPVMVTKEELARCSYVFEPTWRLNAILQPVSGVEKHIKAVAQIVSRDYIKCSEIYAHTGFTRINGELVYLYHGGIIGAAKDINVDLSQDKLEQYYFTDKEFDLKEALKTSYSILNVADVKITIPLLATTYLAPLRTLFNYNGISPDYILWIEGKTGTRKSSLTAVSLSHFGNFSRNDFPCSFRDTLNSLEKKAFVLKDTLLCVDDFNPEAVGNGKTYTAEKLFAMYGDRTGRDRMSADGQTLKSPYTARGLAIVTAECFPEVAQSRFARAIIVDVKPDSIDLNKLRELQENTEILSFGMKGYIEWIINNEATIISEAKERYKTLQTQTQANQLHGRTNEAVNVMTIGFNLFLKFLQENNIITDEELKEKAELCNATLTELANNQSKEIEAESPVAMCVESIQQLYETEKVQILDYNHPRNPVQNCPLLGYVDHEAEKYYFMPDIMYKEIVKFYREQGIKFPVSKSALLKYLENEGYLYRTPKSDRRTIKKKVPNKNTVLPVVAIYKDKLGLDIEKEYISDWHKKQEELKNSITKTAV